jgi:hypothetical protein
MYGLESYLCVWVVVGGLCALLAAVSVPQRQAGLAVALGFLLGPIGVLAAILISIRRAIEGERREVDVPLPKPKPLPATFADLPPFDHLPPIPPDEPGNRKTGLSSNTRIRPKGACYDESTRIQHAGRRFLGTPALCSTNR